MLDLIADENADIEERQQMQQQQHQMQMTAASQSHHNYRIHWFFFFFLNHHHQDQKIPPENNDVTVFALLANFFFDRDSWRTRAANAFSSSPPSYPLYLLVLIKCVGGIFFWFLSNTRNQQWTYWITTFDRFLNWSECLNHLDQKHASSFTLSLCSLLTYTHDTNDQYLMLPGARCNVCKFFKKVKTMPHTFDFNTTTDRTISSLLTQKKHTHARRIYSFSWPVL